MQHQIRHAEITEQGPKHGNNDDFFISAPELKLYIVCDGVSGHAGGNVASKMAAETVLQYIRGKLAGRDFPSIQEAAAIVRDGIFKANEAIFDRGNADPALNKMATTLELVWQVGDHILCAHTGDSRVYLWRRGKLLKLTKDHSFVQEMMDNGTMTEDQAKKSPLAHALIHAIGIRATARVDLLAPEVQDGDVFLVCSDGIYGGCNDGQIATVLNRATADLPGAVSELVRSARLGGSTDDATAIVLAITGAPSEKSSIRIAKPPTAPVSAPAPTHSTPAPASPAPATHAPAVPPPFAGSKPAAPLPQDKLNALDLSPCFGELSFVDKTKLLEIAKQKRFAPGEILAREGEISDQLWVLISGKVRITERGALVADRVGPLTLGEAALMEQEPRAATMTITEEAHVLEFERARVLAFFAPHMQNPAAQVYRAIATLEHKRMRELTHQLADKAGLKPQS